MFEQQIQEIKRQLEHIELLDVPVDDAYDRIEKEFKENELAGAPEVVILQNLTKLEDFTKKMKMRIAKHLYKTA